MRKLVSIVIPCYNEEEVIGETIKRLKAFREGLQDLDVEFIFVNDGSRDRTLELLYAAQEEDKDFRVVAFARNFGHQIAVTAGVDAARGDAVVLIDADLQDPPEVVHEMIAKWQEGYQVVYGTRTDRPGESAFKLATARSFYRLLNRLSDVPIPLDTGDFRLMDRKVVTALAAMPERDRFVRGMVSWVGFKQIGYKYSRPDRQAGTTQYSFRQLFKLALNGIFNFSEFPIKFISFLGISTIAISVLYFIITLVKRFTSDYVPDGFTALVFLIILFGDNI